MNSDSQTITKKDIFRLMWNTHASFITFWMRNKIYIYIMFSNCNVFWKWVYFYTENNTWARVDMESLFELNTRKGIPCLEATMYDFIYHINTIALQWQEKPPSLINEIKRIDNRTLRWSEGSRWKTRWIMITNKTMGVIFN